MIPIEPGRIRTWRMPTKRLWQFLRQGLLAAVLAVAGAASAAAETPGLPPLMDPANQEHLVGKVIFVELVTPDLAAAKNFWLVSGNCGCFGGIPRASFITQPAGWWICGQHKRVAHNPTAATSAEAPSWAGKFLDEWCGQVMRSRIEPMKKIARTLRSHRALILNYFRARKQLSSGVVEGLNNKAKLTMRKSYGFRTFHVTEIALYHALGKLPEPNVAHRFF